MEVRKLQRHEVDLYRGVRLRMLADSPDAFGTRFEEVEPNPPSFWVERVEHFTNSPDRVAFIAIEGEEACGSVSGRVMRPPVLTAEQAAVFSRALAGTAPSPADADLLGPRWREVATALASRAERDPRQVFDFLSGAGLGFPDIARILPFPPPPDGVHGGPGRPYGAPPGAGHEGPPGPPPPFMVPTRVTVMIGGMWVAPAYRRQGLGRRLIEAVIAWAETRGAEGLELGVVEGNVPAIALYQKLGFAIVDRPMPPMPGDAHAHAPHFLFMERDLRLAPANPA